MGLMDNAKEVAGKLKLGPHHTIERFGVIFTAISAMFVLLIGSTAFSAWNSSRADLSAAALYSEGFTTSLTQQSGDIVGVYVSEDGMRAMLLMELSGGAGADQVWSSNAENYQAFLGGMAPNQTPDRLRTNINGNIVSFGATGYMGVVLSSDEPFTENPQILSLTMRNNAELVAGEEPAPELLGTSFAEYDQWRVFFNPGASEATTISALEGRGIDAEAVYAEVLLNEEEEELHAEMDQTLQTMRADLRLIEEYENELERTSADGLRIAPPELPAAIVGDVITGEPAVMEGEEVVQASSLELETDWVDPRGWDLNWRETSVSEGFLDSLAPEGQSRFVYLENKAAGIASGDSADAPEVEAPLTAPPAYRPADDFSVNDIEWILSDGSDLAEQGDSLALSPLRDLMNNLSAAYQSYYDNKVEYQVTQQGALLDLELQLDTVESTYSINSNEDALQTY